MNEKLENILEMPAPTKAGILAGTLLLIIGVYWLYFFRSVHEELSTLKETIEGPQGLQAKISQKEGIARNLQAYQKEVELLDVELKKALSELPDKREIDQLLSSISDKARDSGLEVPLFKPQTEQKRDFYAEVPVEIEVQGSYHQVATFFDEVGHLERIVNIDQFLMSEPVIEEENAMLRTALTATTFRFLEESERPELDPEKKDKKRRRKKAASDEE